MFDGPMRQAELDAICLISGVAESPGSGAVDANLGRMSSVEFGDVPDDQRVVLTGSGAGVVHGVALKFASLGSRRNDVLV